MIDEADIIKAPSCPHYITRAFYDARYMVVGPDAAGRICCARCTVYGPPRLYGEPNAPGRKPVPRVSVKNPTRLERRAA